MAGIIIVGSQFGDEGKGKIVDYLVETLNVEHVARYQGGNNAGHTVVVKGEKFKLHNIPSGVIHGKVCMLGNGMVIDPDVLLSEIKGLQARGIDPKLIISPLAHVITQKHKDLDRKDTKIGTTKRGIGPAYADKISRTGMRVGELNNSELSKYIGDVSLKLNEALDKNKNVLFEGAQGTLLDIDHGTYPYVTSSNTIAGGACTGTGVSPKKIKLIIGVAKAYTTRVGSGPFPTELADKTGDSLREKGAEFGTTTGRPRRCGWLEIPMLNYSVRVNGLDAFALTKIDVLSGLKELKICTAYEHNGKTLDSFPTDAKVLEKVKPVYEILSGWGDINLETWHNSTKWPKEIHNYIETIEKLTRTPISIISFGPGREDTFIRAKLKV